VLTILVVALAALSLSTHAMNPPFVSSEVKFADQSLEGLLIVPASCPSSPHYAGECGVTSPQDPDGGGGGNAPAQPSSNACVIGHSPSTIISGGTSLMSWNSNYQIFGIPFVVTGTITPTPGVVGPSGSTSVSPNVTTTYTGTFSPTGSLNGIPQSWLTPVQCSSLITVLPRDPGPTSCTQQFFCVGTDRYRQETNCTNTFIETCTYGCANGVCLGPPSPSGFIRVRPSLLRSGETTIVEWSTSHTASCSVTENNPNISDSWTGTNGTQTSSPINGQTTYTLSCTGLDGSNLGRSATVNIVPVFDEQ
jgi:hypothetical protein